MASDDEFKIDEITFIVKDVVRRRIGDREFAQEKVKNWNSDILTGIIKELQKQNKQLKYVVTILIAEKTGAGLHTAMSTLWDGQSDGCATIRWENKSMFSVITVFGLAM
ncbi:unnamed protein product [Didymodactylos carnosus]|uniref:Dynein light chain n=1 Tax=Didymodactylos carnosus TaxID=1234261 RepID=A0A814CCS3_9BILA|nr:unnamed protein product [Didymodactylos carnosus]CAF0938479.1 unnamed protein product [Didymodactylos carnosus]CAF3544915.1 unnamed protein product [Didymodactylos carnosus]CAF3715325.1 unnamed protein product [Didymodactylos carnosus]